MDFTQLCTKLKEAERRTTRACYQMVILNDKLENLRIRYHRAVKQKKVEDLRYKLFGEEPVYDPNEEEYGEYTEQ
jgi:hypothetical protein